MPISTTTTAIDASWNDMGFFHMKGEVPSHELATQFAGPNGRVATLPEMIKLRLQSPTGSDVWKTYFVTTSAEYFGRDVRGQRVIAIQHGVGPLSTSKGVVAAYAIKNDGLKNAKPTPGTISQHLFDEILAGEHGPVEILAIPEDKSVLKFFLGPMTTLAGAVNSIAQLRMGPDLTSFLTRHDVNAKAYFKSARNGETRNGFPCEVSMIDIEGCGSRFHYQHGEPAPGAAWAHLLSMSASTHTYYAEHGNRLTITIGLHEFRNATRYVGISAPDHPTPCHGGPDFRKIVTNRSSRPCC